MIAWCDNTDKIKNKITYNNYDFSYLIERLRAINFAAEDYLAEMGITVKHSSTQEEMKKLGIKPFCVCMNWYKSGDDGLFDKSGHYKWNFFSDDPGYGAPKMLYTSIEEMIEHQKEWGQWFEKNYTDKYLELPYYLFNLYFGWTFRGDDCLQAFNFDIKIESEYIKSLDENSVSENYTEKRYIEFMPHIKNEFNFKGMTIYPDVNIDYYINNQFVPMLARHNCRLEHYRDNIYFTVPDPSMHNTWEYMKTRK